MEWNTLYPTEKQVYIENQNLIESGMYVGFKVEELTILLQRSAVAAGR